MPGWHEATKDARDAGRVQMLGIVQEQHGDRARLFMQWKKMDWPLLVDPLNLYAVKLVPYTLFIDEWGVVRNNRPQPADLEAFLATEYEKPAELATPRTTSVADVHVLFANDEDLTTAIDEYQRLLEKDPDAASLHFRLGVAFRARFETDERRAGDFEKAIEHWSKARELDPNQYIWRRRIQQYGPRLDKPYSFYDWVNEAREEIRARGETPLELTVEPGGAEFAHPAPAIESAETEAREPDPERRIERDPEERGLITIETVIVPNTTKPGSYRVHLLFEPNTTARGHWNNEAEPMQVWIDAPEGWAIDRPLITVPNASTGATSSEIRHVEFEIARTDEAAPAAVTIRGYALANVCEDTDGVCLYRRQEFSVAIEE